MSSVCRAVLVLPFLLGRVYPAAAAEVSVQLANPDLTTSVRVLLDRMVIYEGLPRPAPPIVGGTLSATIARIATDDKPHVLTAYALTTHAKAQLHWIPHFPSGAWVVIRYYPGQRYPGELPFFTFSLQSMPALKK